MSSMKQFDVVIGNPPYQGNHPRSPKLWNLFTVKSIDIVKDKGFLAYITPISWISEVFFESKQFVREIITTNNLLYLNKDVNNHFKVGEKIGYFIIKKEPSTSTIDIDDTVSIKSSIIKKVYCQNKEDRLKVVTSFIKKEPKLLSGECSLEKTDIHTEEILYSSCKRVWSIPCEHTISNKRWKVLLNISGNYHKPGKEYVTYSYDIAAGFNYLTVYATDENNAKDLYRYLTSKIIVAFVNIAKTGGFNLRQIEKLPHPTQRLLECQTDDEYYDYFGITQEERDYINKRFI
jgi:hypothetical protein